MNYPKKKMIQTVVRYSKGKTIVKKCFISFRGKPSNSQEISIYLSIDLYVCVNIYM